jgi:hypothetical protein
VSVNNQTSVPPPAQPLQLYARRLRDELASVEQTIASYSDAPAEVDAGKRPAMTA